MIKVKIQKVVKEGKLNEKAKRDYKAEYKKYGSSDKAKKYRAELNAYNRKKEHMEMVMVKMHHIKVERL